jgi:hypothetical protein
VGRGTVLRRHQGGGQRLGRESRVPRFSAEAHLDGLFGDERAAESEAADETSEPYAAAELEAFLPAAADHGLRAQNAKREDWISREGEPDRTIVRGGYRRRSDYEVSTTDPDASLMQHKRGASRMGYHAHYVVDGGKARVILNVLVTPADVTENQPMLDLLFRTAFRWRARVRRVTGDAKYGTKEIVAAVEKEGIRAYISMADFEGRSPYYGASRFAYDAEQDLYICPKGESLRLYTHSYTERLKRYRADAESCNACPLKPECTPGDSGRVLMRSFDEELLERVRAYRGSAPYEKALRKRRVWVEPAFGEAKEWHGMRRFRLRRLRRVNMEAMVIAAGQNIKRLLTFPFREPRRLAQAEALRPPAPLFSVVGYPLRSHRVGNLARPSRVFQHAASFYEVQRNPGPIPMGVLPSDRDNVAIQPTSLTSHMSRSEPWVRRVASGFPRGEHTDR